MTSSVLADCSLTNHLLEICFSAPTFPDPFLLLMKAWLHKSNALCCMSASEEEWEYLLPPTGNVKTCWRNAVEILLTFGEQKSHFPYPPWRLLIARAPSGGVTTGSHSLSTPHHLAISSGHIWNHDMFFHFFIKAHSFSAVWGLFFGLRTSLWQSRPFVYTHICDLFLIFRKQQYD